MPVEPKRLRVENPMLTVVPATFSDVCLAELRIRFKLQSCAQGSEQALPE